MAPQDLLSVFSADLKVKCMVPGIPVLICHLLFPGNLEKVCAFPHALTQRNGLSGRISGQLLIEGYERGVTYITLGLL